MLMVVVVHADGCLFVYVVGCFDVVIAVVVVVVLEGLL